MSGGAGATPSVDLEPLARIANAVEAAAHLLPAQGPITVFVHHNTLHAFEQLPFAQAVEVGASLLGGEPWLAEERYRQALLAGRIADEDLVAVVDGELGEAAQEPLPGELRRADLLLELLTHGIPEVDGAQLEWWMTESEARRSLRPDLLEGERAEVLRGRGEEAVVAALWDASLSAASRAPAPSASEPRPDARLRDLLLRHCGEDVDAQVHPLLIRLCGAFLDQGVAYWPMPGREQGFYRAVLELYGSEAAPPLEPWSHRLVALLSDDRQAGRDALASIEVSITALGVGPAGLEAAIVASSLALRGWAGMFRQLEERPDRVPVRPLAARFVDFLAVRLLIERAIGEQLAATTLDHHGPLAALWQELSAPVGTPPRQQERAWRLFNAAQLLGWAPARLEALSAAEIAALEGELLRFDSLERRRLLHLAYERHLHHHVLDSLAAAPTSRSGETPRWQGLFCLDEREESLRRYLEELAPEVETLGVAGFFGVAMYYRGLDDAHARPLCPIAIRPTHELHEVPIYPDGAVVALRGHTRRVVGRSRRLFDVGSRTFVRGTLVASLLGGLTAIPLLLRVLAPGWSAKLSRAAARLLDAPMGTRIAIERREQGATIEGAVFGYTVDEMAELVAELLGDLGMVGRLAPLVLLVGHRSSSVNNPLESAYDCGACGGGRGGANARAFAAMANHRAVRALLRERGVELPDTTWFVGAEHDSACDLVTLFDRALVPETHLPALDRAVADLGEACAWNARERCRRFDSAPTWLPPSLALAHVEARANNLAQPRPEYCHATNAFALVGRRARTRGLFLDRRAFLISYDPERDEDGSVLARLLAAVVPVTAGINLEYFFGSIDPVVYGCDTKLPHNITALLGVMDGHASDLRTGLPVQTLELHEPVRQLMVIEAPPERVRQVVLADPLLRRVFDHRWSLLATIDPAGRAIHRWRDGEFHPYEAKPLELPREDSSRSVYQGLRGHLPITEVVTAASREGAS